MTTAPFKDRDKRTLNTTQSKLEMKVYECTWTFMEFHGKKHGFFMVEHRESSMFMELRFNDVEGDRLPCESIIGHQWH